MLVFRALFYARDDASPFSLCLFPSIHVRPGVDRVLEYPVAIRSMVALFNAGIF